MNEKLKLNVERDAKAKTVGGMKLGKQENPEKRPKILNLLKESTQNHLCVIYKIAKKIRKLFSNAQTICVSEGCHL